MAFSKFWGIISVNRELDFETAERIVKNQFVEVILAPSVVPEAVEIIGTKKNVRLLEYGSAPTTATKIMFRED